MCTTDKPRDQDKSYNPRSEVQPKREFNSEGSGTGRPLFSSWNVNKIYTPLSTDRAKILEEIKDKPFLNHAELAPIHKEEIRTDITIITSRQGTLLRIIGS